MTFLSLVDFPPLGGGAGWGSSLLLGALLTLNLFTFLLYGVDKWKARRGRWRIPEATLLLLALAGGSLGAWCGMRVWRHKTRHRKFRYGLPLILALQVGLAVWAAK